mgnify:FL=1
MKKDLNAELTVLLDVVRKLSTLNIDYMLTGSLALNYYAKPRMTRDIDIIIKMLFSDINRLVKVFNDKYYIEKKSIKEALERKSSFNIIHNTKIIKIDLLILKNTNYRKTEFKRKKKIKIMNENINIVSKEDLIISKLYWSVDSKSEKQRQDILNLLATGLDKKYLQKWLRELQLIAFFKEFINARYI